MPLTRRNLVLGAMVLALAHAARAGKAETPQVISARTAHEAVRRGEMILIDIRTPAEWAASGVAEGAWPLDMTRRDFGPKLMQVLKDRGERPVAMICATGGRTAFLQKLLAENGMGEVLDVGEGMFGSAHGRGWLKEKLPVVTPEAASAAMPTGLR